MTYAGVKSRNGYHDAGTENIASGDMPRAWWWTSTSSARYWTTCSSCGSGYNAITMPYYIRLDNNGTAADFVSNSVTGWYNYGYMNSIFSSSTNYHLYSSCSCESSYVDGGTYNSTVLSRVRTQFYFSVRCVRDKAVQDYERK